MNLDEGKIRENKKGYLLSFSVPAIFSMVLTAFVTVADGFFIGNYTGLQGHAAVNLGLSVVYLFCALGLMISAGGSAITGILNGEGKKSKDVGNFYPDYAYSFFDRNPAFCSGFRLF